MKQITNLLESKRNIAGLLLLASLIGITYNIQENSGRIKRLTNFESGIQTCFSRVNQTYTAKMLGDTASNYLTTNFQNLTEECFAEGILQVEDSFKVELSLVAKKLSTLASNVHWFHEDILSPGSARAIANDGESRDVGARFEKIETTKDEILDATEGHKSEITDTLNKEKNIFYVSATLLVLIMISEYMSTTRRRLSNQARENEAQAELMDNGGVVSVKVGEIIRTALEQNDLFNCSKLFANYHSQQSFDKTIKNKNKLSLDELVTPLANQSPAEVNEKIDKIWNDDSIGVSADNLEGKMLKDLNLEQVSSAIVGLLAEKLFSQGVQLDIKIPENLSVKARAEELEQTLYHLVNYAINKCQSDSGDKRISMSAHRLGDIVAFDLIHSGQGFDEELLKQRVGITCSARSLDIDLQICQELLQEIEGKVQFDNKLNQKGEVVGGRVKIIFKSGESAPRLVDLKVGSKKEILEILNSQTNSSSIN
ncbi:MAG: hypothetical protein ACXVLQ_00655 [Bacteriovorax sp.]